MKNQKNIHSFIIKHALEISNQLLVILTGRILAYFLVQCYPGMIEGFTGTYTHAWIDLQKFSQQIFALLTNVTWQFQRTKGEVVCLLTEGRMDCQHLIHENSYTPAVNFVVVIGPFCYLGRYIVQSAAESLSLPVCLDGPSEVSYLEMISKANNVFRLQVSMHDPVSMHVIDAIQYLIDIFGCFMLVEGSQFQYFLIEIMKAELHNQIDLILAHVKSIGRQDIRMMAVQMNLHLVYEKLQLNLVFAEGFDSDDHVVDVRNSQNYVSSLTFTQLLYHLQFVLLFLTLQLSHFLQCFVHVIQLGVDVQLFLEVLIVQAHGELIGLQFLLDLIDVSGCVQIGIGYFLGRSGVQKILVVSG